MSEGEIILYKTEDGKDEIQLRVVNGTVWLPLNQIAELFGRDKSVISRHIKAIFDDGELTPETIVARYATIAPDERTFEVEHYRLEMILAVGYRVRSPRGIQFRRWVTSTLREYLIKGFVMNDDRLKDPAWDYFDELLERIRDIRASEARFYQKVRDILALSEDYDARSPDINIFYATIQNKMLYAVTNHTAGELIRERSDPDKPNMGLMTWRNADRERPLRKSDVGIAKNYLNETEISDLNLIVETFLNTAELRARRRQTMRLVEWDMVLGDFLTSNDLPMLRGAGSISARDAEEIVHDRYTAFDAKRKEAQARIAAETDDLEELKRIADAAAEHKQIDDDKK